MFKTYIGLVAMTEAFVDGELKRLDQTRDRPFLYVATEGEYDGFWYKKLQGPEDLKNVGNVLAFVSDPKLEGYCFHGEVGEGSRYFDDNKGKIISVADFLKRK